MKLEKARKGIIMGGIALFILPFLYTSFADTGGAEIASIVETDYHIVYEQIGEYMLSENLMGYTTEFESGEDSDIGDCVTYEIKEQQQDGSYTDGYDTYYLLPEIPNVHKETSELIFDLNMDYQEDMIYLTYEEKEGSQYISKFEVKIEGVSGTFTIEDYDASFEKIEVFDFNQDAIDELVILFNTHGNGGQGTHDIVILSIDDNSLKTYNFEPNTEGLAELKDSWNIDEPYTIQKVLYSGNEEMMIRQYVWGEQGHSDYVGDLVSIISLNKESGCIMPAKSWMELGN